MEKPEMMQENLTRPWHERIDPVTKLLLIAVLTLLDKYLCRSSAHPGNDFSVVVFGEIRQQHEGAWLLCIHDFDDAADSGVVLPSQRDDCFFFRRNCVLPGRFDVCRFAWLSNHRDRSCNEFFHADDDDF